MRAVVMPDGALGVDEVSLPALQPGQVRAEVLACGICGSDLHALHHAGRMVEMSELTAEPGGIAPRMMDPSRDVVMGHEFTARVLEVGPNVGNCTPGDVVVSLPVVMAWTGMDWQTALITDIGLALAYVHTGRGALAHGAIEEAVKRDPGKAATLKPLLERLEARSAPSPH